MTTFAPFARPLYIMLKPAGALCNLACDYCYYLEKSKLYQDNPKHVMSDELLEKFIEEYINSQTSPNVLFTWHGGETLMRPLSFYQKAVELQRKYARGRQIDNCLQTNGTLLTDEWCRFLHDNQWLVGISIDGPQEFHDEYRKNKQGKPSFVKVMQGINLLKKHNVEWNAMAVVNDYNADYPLEFYHFFKELDCHYIQFAPIVERLAPHADGRHLAAVDEDSKEGLADFGQLLHPAVRLHPGQLGGRATGRVHPGPDVRARRGHGVQRRCLLVRPLRLPPIQAGQHLFENTGGDDVRRTPTEIRTCQAGVPAYAMQRMPLSLCLQRRVPQEPLLQDQGRRARSELPVPRLLPVLRPRGALHGLYEARAASQARPRQCDGSHTER